MNYELITMVVGFLGILLMFWQLNHQINARFDSQNARFDSQNARFDSKFEHLESRLDRLENKIDFVNANLSARIDSLYIARIMRLKSLLCAIILKNIESGFL